MALVCGVDGHQTHGMAAAALDIGQIVDRLVSDQPVIARHQGLGAGRHIAPAARLIGLGQEIQAIGGVGIFLQVEIELGMAFVVGLAVLKLGGVAVLGVADIIEVIIRPGTEGREGRD